MKDTSKRATEKSIIRSRVFSMSCLGGWEEEFLCVEGDSAEEPPAEAGGRREESDEEALGAESEVAMVKTIKTREGYEREIQERLGAPAFRKRRVFDTL